MNPVFLIILVLGTPVLTFIAGTLFGAKLKTEAQVEVNKIRAEVTAAAEAKVAEIKAEITKFSTELSAQFKKVL